MGGKGADRSKHAWRQIYRALQHGIALNACKNGKIIRKFPQPIEDFANAFVVMQEKRQSADYDPHATFAKSEVLSDIELVEQTIKDFENIGVKHKRAFCALVLFKPRD